MSELYGSLHTPLLNTIEFLLVYITFSKINIIVYQIDKYLMVQIWFLKFIKSIFNVITLLFPRFKLYCVNH